jgi:8-oxo-dGTP diphosphatase
MEGVKTYRKQHIVTSVVAVIVDDREQVLLTRRSIPPFAGQWVMPGGKIELGEPMLSALHREVREEVGIDVVVVGLVDVFEHVAPGADNDHHVILYFRCHPARTDVTPNPDEVDEARWVPRSVLDLYTTTMPAGTRHVLSRLFPELEGAGGIGPVPAGGDPA